MTYRVDSRLRLRVSVGLLLLGLAGTPAAASGSSSSTEFSTNGPSEDDFSTLQTMANEDGISLEEAVRRYAWQDEFAIRATLLEEMYPTLFSYATITHGASPKAYVHFKSEIPPSAYQHFTGIEVVNVSLQRNYGLSAGDIRDQVTSSHQVASQQSTRNMATSFDLDARTVVVEVNTSGLNESDSAELLDSVQGAVEEVATVTVEVDEAPTLAGDGEASVYGGARLERSGSSSLSCSTAFNVKKDGVSGILTAGHCDSTPYTVENTSGGTEWAATNKGSHQGWWGDFRWLTTTQTETTSFYTAWSTRATLKSVANPVDNQRLCRFGHKTGRSCSAYVADTYLCRTIDLNYLCHLVRMDRDTADKGDSGGPWFSGSTAYGVHTGQVGTIFGSRDVFSRMTYVDEALGASALK